ncbi:protein FAR1-RELATED SEQUENCE 5 [Citrus sinensis]|nr:protein FAR1-RELATED SEQUENCE 5 [Citrus sinensis]
MSWTSDSQSDHDISYQILEIAAHEMHAEKSVEWAANDGDPPNEMNKDSVETDIEIEEEEENEVNNVSNTANSELTLRMIETMDVLGREFVTDKEADSFFCKYAKAMGFGVRRHNKRWNTKGVLMGRKWVCSREGYRPKKFLHQDNRTREARPLTRTGCQAAFKIKRKDEDSAWICTQFNAIHNHTLTPPEHVHYIRCHRKISGADLIAASSLHNVGMKPSQIHEYMVDRSGGYNKVGYLRKDMQNQLDTHRRKLLHESDAESCLSYLEGKKCDDPAFYFAYTVNEDNRLGDLFWCDGGCRADYAVFGDVVAFDATYRTNAYRKPFVVLLGINQHRRTIVFGFALLSDETEHTYTWLLETFLKAVDGKQPKSVITDGDKAMRNAISKKFPQSVHRLCCWHLARNAQANINNKEFTNGFQRCMLQPYTKDQFEKVWTELVARHNVEHNEWVKMYSDKQMWAEAFLQGSFFGGMRTTQRSEGMNAFLNHYVSIRLRLVSFVKQMDRLMDRQRDVEGKDDYDSFDGRPVLTTHLKAYEGQVGDIYTRAIFRIIRDQINKEGVMITTQISNDDIVKVFHVRKYDTADKEWNVEIKGMWDSVSCSCLMIETLGSPCSHIFAVMKTENVRTIPKCIILGRWTKNAKIGVCSHNMNEKSNSTYMSIEARLGSLHAACRNLQRLAANSSEAFQIAIADLHNLSLRLEAMTCYKEKEKLKGQLGKRSHVRDPTVVLTKGCRKKKKMGPPPKRRCGSCGQPGHTIRKCKAKEQPEQANVKCATQGSQFICENNVVMNTRGLGFKMRIETPIEYNEVNAQSTHSQNSNSLSLESSSQSWYQQFPVSTDNDSTDNTGIGGFLPNFEPGIGSTSTFATNHGCLWNGHGC